MTFLAPKCQLILQCVGLLDILASSDAASGFSWLFQVDGLSTLFVQIPVPLLAAWVSVKPVPASAAFQSPFPMSLSIFLSCKAQLCILAPSVSSPESFSVTVAEQPVTTDSSNPRLMHLEQG